MGIAVSSIGETISISGIVGISLGLGISRPLSVVGTIGIGVGTIGVSTIAKTGISVSTIESTISKVVGISISLRLGISRPLSVVGTIGIGVGTIGPVSISTIESTIAIAKTVTSKVVGISLSLGLGISRPLGDVDDSSRVGNISASTGITSNNSGDGSGGDTSNANGVSSVGHSIASSIGSSIGVGGSCIASIAQAKTIAIGTIVGISISLSLDDRETNHNSKLVHVEMLNVPNTIPC